MPVGIPLVTLMEAKLESPGASYLAARFTILRGALGIGLIILAALYPPHRELARAGGLQT